MGEGCRAGVLLRVPGHLGYILRAFLKKKKGGGLMSTSGTTEP